MSWLSFFVAFLGWFALAPLTPVIKDKVSATMSAEKDHGDPATRALAAHLEFPCPNRVSTRIWFNWVFNPGL